MLSHIFIAQPPHGRHYVRTEDTEVKGLVFVLRFSLVEAIGTDTKNDVRVHSANIGDI